jgi:anti-anti-sigma factor
MTEAHFQHLNCPVVVFAIREAQVQGDTLADALRDELLAVYTGSGATHAVVDFKGVKYIASAGFRPLLTLLKQVRERGGRMVLCNLAPEIEETFAVTRLISTSGSARVSFEVQPDVPAAVAGLYAPQGPAPAGEGP